MNPQDDSTASSDPLRDATDPPASKELAPPGPVSAGNFAPPTDVPGQISQRSVLPSIPEDLRVPWNWTDIFLFVILYILCLVAAVIFVGFGFAAIGVTLPQMRASIREQAFFVVIVQVVQSALVFAFLVAQMRLKFRSPFWSTIGWRPLESGKLPRRLVYLGLILGGFAFSLAVQLAAGFAGTKSKLPIEVMFQDPRSVLLLGIMAITVAPLVEETIFRGYLYPVLARSFGVGAGVVITGVLFGLLHAEQLWGGWVQIGLLMLVGVFFTLARAVSRSVVASYLLHVSYNLLPSLATFFEFSGIHHRGFGR
jgi:uncharacterized protein